MRLCSQTSQAEAQHLQDQPHILGWFHLMHMLNVQPPAFLSIPKCSTSLRSHEVHTSVRICSSLSVKSQIVGFL